MNSVLRVATVQVLLFGSVTWAQTLRVDIGHADTASSTNDVQPGFDDFSEANRRGSFMGRSSKRCSRTLASPLGRNGQVTVSIEAPDAASETLAFRDRGDMRAEPGDLAEDFVFNEAQLNLVFADLKPGVYAVTTWHHDPRYVGGMIDIAVGSRTVAGGLAQTTGFQAGPATAAFTVEVRGADPVVIQIASQSKDDRFVAYLNGFSLTAVPVVAAFDVDCQGRPVTQAIGGAGGEAFARLCPAPDARHVTTCSATDHGVTLTLSGVGADAYRDQGAGGALSGCPQIGLLRDYVQIRSGATDGADSRMTVRAGGLEPGARYLLTWYAYVGGEEVDRPMFIYQDRIAEENLLFTNVDRFLYTKENQLHGDPSPDDASHTFLATADSRGEIHMVAARGAVVGSDDAADGPTTTVLSGLTIGSATHRSPAWLEGFAARPKLAGPSATNPLGDSLAKDYSLEVELIPPTEPEDAEATFEVEPGLRVELVAAEPLVMDPVGMSFDERGRLFVAEMRGYNQGNRVPSSEARQFALETEKLGRVKLLEDTDGDGRFDKATVYVDDLIWPNGVFAYGGGVFVAAAPDLLYCRDTDGDGRADVRQVVFTGFGFSNWQHLPNSFRWGLDNRIHGASGSGGGQIRCLARSDDAPVLIRGRDFAFDPRTLKLAPTNSSAQFGLSFDSWGNKFLTSNSAHILLVFFPDRYIARNPLLAAPRSWRLIAAAGTGADVFRISPPEPHRVVWTRMRATGVIKGLIERGGAPTGYITAAGGTTIYRGDAWPAKYRGNSFTPECSGNLIHRNVLQADGIGQIARRVDKGREFLASRDIWFRPVNMLNGPDGNLYMADMYRQVINEGVVLPPPLRKCFDLTEGCQRGRIYRVVPQGFHQPKIPDLRKAKTAELVALLEHANCWHHTTAARLLYERQDLSAVEPLVAMAAESSPLGRMHAMYALDGLSALTPQVILPRLDDEHSRVREHAVRLAEKVLAHSEAVRRKLFSMTADGDVRVRYQLAFTLGEMPCHEATGALAAVAASDADDSWIRLAILSSSTGRAGALFAQLAANTSVRAGGARILLEQLAEQAGLHAQRDPIDEVVRALETLPQSERPLVHRVIRHLLHGLEIVTSPLRHDLVASKNGFLARRLEEMLRQAEGTAVDTDAPDDARTEAIRSLRLGAYDRVVDVLVELLDSRQPQKVGMAAMETLGRFADAAAADAILDAWVTLTPALRQKATDALFARRERLALLLAAIDEERIRPSQLDPARIQLLLTHPDASIRTDASRLLGDQAPGPRGQVIDEYQEALQISADRDRGREVFRRECSKCHRLEGVGYDLGLPLGSIKDRGKEGILLNLLDPNRNVNPQYANYVVLTDQGLSITGMIAAETANSITLERAEGESDTVLRANIDELVDTGMSIMPEGLEKQLTKQNMADLIEYLMSVQ